MRYQGRITEWKDRQGYGFITPNGGGARVFVHIRAFTHPQRRPGGGEAVHYELATDADGRTHASQVAYAVRAAPVRARHSPLPLALALLFLALLSVAALRDALPLFLLPLYVGASLLAFAVYAWDKSAARHKRWRMQESMLHLLGLAGGWPGALVAQRLLRHKTRKWSFQWVFWATVLLNCAALAWLFTPQGHAALHTLLAAAR